MFYRQKFVTNSSSSSFIAFGVELDRGQMIDVCEYLVEQNTARALEEVSKWPNVNMDEYLKDPRSYLEENDMDYEFMEALLPGSIEIELPPDGDTFYLTIGWPRIDISETGVVSIADPEALVAGYNTLTDIMVGTGIGATIDVMQDSWWS